MKEISMADMGGFLINKEFPLDQVCRFLEWFRTNGLQWGGYQLRLQKLFVEGKKGMSPKEVIKLNGPYCSLIPEEFADCLAHAAVIKCPEWEVVFK